MRTSKYQRCFLSWCNWDNKRWRLREYYRVMSRRLALFLYASPGTVYRQCSLPTGHGVRLPFSWPSTMFSFSNFFLLWNTLLNLSTATDASNTEYSKDGNCKGIFYNSRATCRQIMATLQTIFLETERARNVLLNVLTTTDSNVNWIVAKPQGFKE